jgi:hypothetical protein
MDWQHNGVEIIPAGDLDPNTPQTPGMTRAAAVSRGVPYTSEGMAIRGDRILLLPEDSPSRLFQFSFVAPAFQVEK